MSPDPKVRLARGRSAVQAPRCDGAGGARQGAGGRKGPAHQARDERGARRHRARHADCAAGAEARGDRRWCAIAATAMRWASCRPSPPRLRRRGQGRRHRRGRLRCEQTLAAWQAGAERLVRHLARLGAAAGRHRARHHLRHHGRDQHGAWRDGDARRLHDLRRPGDHPDAPRRTCSTSRWSSPCRSPSWSRAPSASLIERTIIRFLYGRPLDTLLATWGLSLVLQQAVRSIFGSDQPRGRRAVVDVGRLPARPAQHHLRPALDRGLRADGLRRP